MTRSEHNPWAWQNDWGFSQAWKITGQHETIYLAGQTGVDADGVFIHHDDFEGEVRLLFRNMQEVLADTGATFEDLVRLTVFIKDMSKIDEFTKLKKEILGGHQPAQSAIGVSVLALPELTLEVEATAVVHS